jgi:hypothetical protein
MTFFYRTILKFVVVPFCCFPLLSGCSTGLEGETVHGMVESPIWFKTASRTTIVNHFSKFCDSYGIARDTSEFRECVRNSEQASRSNTMANYRAIVSGINAAAEQANSPSQTYNPAVTAPIGGYSRSCSSDSSCSTGEVCVKAPGKTRGQCMQSVNKYGIQKYNRTGSSTTSCTTRSDCPYGFTCDRKLKACVR